MIETTETKTPPGFPVDESTFHGVRLRFPKTDNCGIVFRISQNRMDYRPIRSNPATVAKVKFRMFTGFAFMFFDKQKNSILSKYYLIRYLIRYNR